MFPESRRLGTRLPSYSVLLMAVLSACGDGSRQTTGPGSDGGEVPKARLTVTVRVDPLDAAVAGALGWTEAVPGTEVHLLRNGTATWKTATTNASGEAVFEGLLSGIYRVYAGRRLTSAEAQDAGQPIRAFGDGRTFQVSGSSSTLTLELLADTPAGLVISEINNDTPPPWEVNGSYYDGMYFEVYNNSEQLIYLDGTVFGGAYPFGFYDTDHTPCSVSQRVRDDSSGLLTRWVVAFPGGGAEYPIMPGEAKVVAMAAVDHTPVHPELLDLSGADFEIGGPRTADNPAVPNMIDLGLEPWVPALLLALPSTLYLAEPVDPHSMAILFRDSNGRGYVRIPQDALVDVAAFTAIWPDLDQQFPPCIPMLHRGFDRYEGGLIEIGLGIEDLRGSFQRKAIRVGTGRTILQNTNTSAVDFLQAPQTPGWILSN